MALYVAGDPRAIKVAFAAAAADGHVDEREVRGIEQGIIERGVSLAERRTLAEQMRLHSAALGRAAERSLDSFMESEPVQDMVPDQPVSGAPRGPLPDPELAKKDRGIVGWAAAEGPLWGDGPTVDD